MNVISIREARMRRSPETMMNLAMNDPGHLARRKARRDAYWAEIERQAREAEAQKLRAAEADAFAAKAAVGAMAIGIIATLIGLA